MKYEILIMPSAESELETAYQWIFERDPTAAAAWYNGVVDACLTLETFPKRCPIAPESKTLQQSIRQLIYGNRQRAYRILFDVAGQTVQILHIRHSARRHLGTQE